MSLTPEEDEALRRINELADFGELPPRMVGLLSELRTRDRRAAIREPLVIAEWLPPRRAIQLPAQREPGDAVVESGEESTAR
jgi:hypothetical protein